MFSSPRRGGGGLEKDTCQGMALFTFSDFIQTKSVDYSVVLLEVTCHRKQFLKFSREPDTECQVLDTFPLLEPSGESRVLGHGHGPGHLALALGVGGGCNDLRAGHPNILRTGHHLGLIVQEVRGAGGELLVSGGHDALKLSR